MKQEISNYRLDNLLKIENFEAAIAEAKSKGATHIDIDICKAPAGSRDHGPDWVRFNKHLTSKEVTEIELKEAEDKVKELKEKLELENIN